MLEVSDRARDVLAALSALLWAFLVVVCWIGHDLLSVIGMVAAGVIAAVYFIMGATVRGRLGVTVPLVFPLLITLGLWSSSFVIAYATRGQSDVFIAGLHPGQFWTMLLFWIGSFVALVVSYSTYFDTYLLRPDDWEAFLAEVEQMKQQHGESGHGDS